MSGPLKLVPASRQRGEATRLQLLDEAERQFAEFGFRGASLNSIAVACGIGNAGALHHFASKEALYKAVLQRLSGDVERELQNVLALDGSAERRLRRALAMQTARIIKEPQRSRLILRELLDNLGRVEHARSLPLSTFVETFCRLIEEAQRDGAATPGPPLALLAQFLGTLSYALVVRPTFARMERDADLLTDEGRWIETVATLAQSALLPQHSRAPRRKSLNTIDFGRKP